MRHSAVTLLPIALLLAAPPAWAQGPEASDPVALGAGPPEAGDGPGRPALFEAGIAAGAAYTADYPASDENSFTALPVPYLIYRGEFLTIGEGGVRGQVVDTPRFQLDLALGASLPADSDDNEARRGMDDLDFLGEVGPELSYRLTEEGADHEFEIELEVKAVLSIGDFEYEGFLIEPELSYGTTALIPGVRVYASLSPQFGLDGLNDYFYEVRPRDVIPGRPRFSAEDGYLGTEATLGVSGRFTPRVRWFVGSQIGLHSGAANEDSPLFRSDVTGNIAVGIAWSFYESDERAPD